MSSSWPTILTKGKAELFAAASASEVAEALHRIALTREAEEPAARGFTDRGVPTMDVMADIVVEVLLFVWYKLFHGRGGRGAREECARVVGMGELTCR